VVLLEIDPIGIAVFELEGNAPRPIDVDRVSGRPMAPQSMKVETWNIHVLRMHGPVEGVKASQNSVM